MEAGSSSDSEEDDIAAGVVFGGASSANPIIQPGDGTGGAPPAAPATGAVVVNPLSQQDDGTGGAPPAAPATGAVVNPLSQQGDGTGGGPPAAPATGAVAAGVGDLTAQVDPLSQQDDGTGGGGLDTSLIPANVPASEREQVRNDLLTDQFGEEKLMIFDLLDCICNGANPTYGANPKYGWKDYLKGANGRYNYFHMQIGAIKEQNGLLYDQLIDWDCYNNGTLLLAFRPDHGNRSLKNRAKEYCNSLGDLNSIADIARDVCRNLSQLLPGQQTITDSIQGTLGFTETTVEDLFKNRTHAHFTDYGELDFCCPFMYNTLFTNNGQVSFSDLRITKTVLDLRC